MKKSVKIILFVVLAVVQLATIVMLFLVRHELKTQIETAEKSDESTAVSEEATTVSEETKPAKKPFTKPVGEGYSAWTLFDIDCDGEDELIESYYKRHTDAPATTRVYESEDDYHDYDFSANCIIYNEKTKEMCLAGCGTSKANESVGASASIALLNSSGERISLYAGQWNDDYVQLVLNNKDNTPVSEFQSYASNLTYIKQFNIVDAVGDISGSEEGVGENPFPIMADICKKAILIELNK